MKKTENMQLYRKEYKETNKEKIKLYHQKYYQANRNKLLNYQNTYYNEHKEEIALKHKNTYVPKQKPKKKKRPFLVKPNKPVNANPFID